MCAKPRVCRRAQIGLWRSDTSTIAPVIGAPSRLGSKPPGARLKVLVALDRDQTRRFEKWSSRVCAIIHNSSVSGSA
jgi:hypothetical protein